MKINYKPLLILAAISFFSCQSSPQKGDIDITTAQSRTMRFVDNFENMELIPLETTDESLVGARPSIYIQDDYITVISSGNCLLFSRKDGTFIRKVGVKGRGHNEYLMLLPGWAIDDANQTILASKGDTPIQYSLTDGMATTPSFEVQFKNGLFGKYIALSDSTWALAQFNPAGNLDNQILFFNKKSIVDSIANYSKFTMNSANINMNFNEIYLYKYSGIANYKSLYCDTIYDISDMKLSPRWVFKGDNLVSSIADLRGSGDKFGEMLPQYIQITNILEDSDNLMFSALENMKKSNYTYNKANEELVELYNSGFVYGDDAELLFWPATISSNMEYGAIYSASQLRELAECDLDEGLSDLKSISQSIGENDNPVVVICTKQ